MIRSAGTGQTFRVFQFKLACALVHEVAGHMLVTFLGRGRSLTPPTITVAGYATQEGGESGRFLEMSLFGGCLEYYRASGQGENQVSQHSQCGRTTAHF